MNFFPLNTVRTSKGSTQQRPHSRHLKTLYVYLNAPRHRAKGHLEETRLVKMKDGFQPSCCSYQQVQVT